MTTFNKLMKDIDFTELQRQEIKKSPFGVLILAMADANLSDKYVMKSDRDALKIVSQYEGREGRFKLGGQSLRITTQEIELIFAIKSGPQRIHLNPKPRKPNTTFANEISATGKNIITIQSLKDCFQRAVKETSEEYAKVVAQVLTLHLLATLFVPTTASRLSWSYVPYVEDLESSTSYAWSAHFTEELIHQLDINHSTPKTTGGCIIGLLVNPQP